jgi:hypothetical protein
MQTKLDGSLASTPKRKVRPVPLFFVWINGIDLYIEAPEELTSQRHLTIKHVLRTFVRIGMIACSSWLPAKRCWRQGKDFPLTKMSDNSQLIMIRSCKPVNCSQNKPYLLNKSTYTTASVIFHKFPVPKKAPVDTPALVQLPTRIFSFEFSLELNHTLDPFSGTAKVRHRHPGLAGSDKHARFKPAEGSSKLSENRQAYRRLVIDFSRPERSAPFVNFFNR